MQVIWKRPDGHHNSNPSDYKVISIGENCSLWLHKKEKKWFPFRVSGGWQDEDATQKLNMLTNLIDSEDDEFIDYIVESFYNSNTEVMTEYLDELLIWLEDLKSNSKGDKWEIEIIGFAIKEIETKMINNKTKIISESTQS